MKTAGMLMSALVCGSLWAVDRIDPIVPFQFDLGKIEQSIRDLREIRTRTGLRRFYLCGPGFNEVSFAPFAPDLYAKMGREMAAVRRGLADTDIELGWWCAPSIRYYSSMPKVEDAWGNKATDNKHCPLDPTFQADWAAKVKAVAETFHPPIINIEDDYTLTYSLGLKTAPCYCPRHLAAFAKRYGKPLTGPEIAAAFAKRTPGNLEIRRAFSAVIGSSLVELASKVRTAVDEVDPKIRICLCEPGNIDMCGNSLEAIIRAFAGKARPALRPYGAIYGAQTTPSDVPAAVGHTMFTLERLPRDIETFYEADPYPHNRFYTSATQMQSLMTGAMFMGSQNLQLYCLQYLDDPLEDSAYADACNALMPRYLFLRNFIEQKASRLKGVRIVWRPEDPALTHAGMGEQLYEGAFLLAKMGLPYTTRRDATCPALMMGGIAETMSDDEIRQLLAGGLLLDAPAAAMLKDRGFGEFLGAEVERVKGNPQILGEQLLPAAGLTCRGRTVNAFYFFNAGTEGSVKEFVTLKPRPGTEVWSQFTGLGGKVITPSITLAKNALGGRVAIMATSLIKNRSSGLYNLRKQELIKNLFTRLAAKDQLPVLSVGTPGLWTLAQVSADGRSMLVHLNNLSGDDRKASTLDFADVWQGATVERLNAKGVPEKLTSARAHWKVPFTLGQMQPEFLLVTRP